MTPKDWLQQELLWGIYDSGLQRKLLQESKPELEDLIKIAKLWENADSSRVAMGTDPSKDLQRIPRE